jgi:GH35 family endo-1,4-beta-xylanase
MEQVHFSQKFSRFLVVGAAMLATSANAQLAKGASKFLGNITTNGAVRSDFGTYWNQITAENECKWGSIEGTKGTYNFKGCNDAYTWAKNNGGHFKFHALLWGSQYPSWLENLSADDTKTAITKWFDAVKKQFPDLEMIDVVNEAIRTGTNTYHSNYQKTKIREALGGDNNDYAFVTTAFKMARERWPNATLIYNDYNTFQWQINEGITLIQTIKKAGAPVDAYGQQGHDLTDMDVTSFKAALKKIHEGVGIPLFITEYDIGTDNDATQKQRYSEQIPEFWDAEYVAGVTLWGYIYGSTWTTNGNSGIIKNGSDRSAMTWLKSYMASNKGKNTTGLPKSGSTGIESRETSLSTAAKPGFVMRNVNGHLVLGVEKDGQFQELGAIGRR